MTLFRPLLLAIAVFCALLPGVSAGQGIGPQLPGTVISGAPDYEAWDRVAVRAERSVESGVSSAFALQRLRAELSGWRDQFLEAQSLNAARISTVNAQLAALGAAPAEGDSEPAQVAARRSDLNDQLNALRAPVVLAQEAYARANGLIGEIDGFVRQKEVARLTTPTALPLVPENWVVGGTALWVGLSAIFGETSGKVGSLVKSGAIWVNLGKAAVLLGIGLILMIRGRAWIIRLQSAVLDSQVRGAALWVFGLSLGLIALPLGGVFALQAAITASGLVGYRGGLLVETLPRAGFFIIAVRWLASHYFSSIRGKRGPLNMCFEDRTRGRRLLNGLGWTMALGLMMVELVTAGDTSGLSAAIILLPIEALVGLFLFRFGRLLSRHCSEVEQAAIYRNRIIAVIGQVAMVVAIVGPVLAIFGYSTAAQALLYPAVSTLAILGLVLLLQTLVVDIYVLFSGSADGARDALVPVLFGMVLLVLALPFVALTWGVSRSDLWELWTRFREGYTLGETRISPTDFMVFVLVFGLGYALTRFAQSTLKTTILPRTKLDLGGQNAVVSGLGYLGIFLAAVVAITLAGIDLSSLAIVAGALSVGIGFGLQNIVSNFVSGIILLIERPISEGDWIEVGGQMGYVRDISVRSTRIETFDRTDVIVPNADLVSGQVTNWTRGNSVGRIILPVGVAYGTDTHLVAKILLEVAEAHPLVLLDPPPQALFVNFGADSLNFEIRALLRDVNFGLRTKSEMNHIIAERFAAAGIEIPFAQRDIWIRNPEALMPGKEQDAT